MLLIAGAVQVSQDFTAGEDVVKLSMGVDVRARDSANDGFGPFYGGQLHHFCLVGVVLFLD